MSSKLLHFVIKYIIMIGKNIKYYRKLANMTQTELANKLKIKQSTLANYENNKRDITTDTLKQLCKILKVSADELLEIDI